MKNAAPQGEGWSMNAEQRIIAEVRAVLASQESRFNAVLAEQQRMVRLLYKIAMPVPVMTQAEAAKFFGRSTKWVRKRFADGTFSDTRPPDLRSRGANRGVFADEAEVYRAEGEDGLRRLKEIMGRR